MDIKSEKTLARDCYTKDLWQGIVILTKDDSGTHYLYNKVMDSPVKRAIFEDEREAWRAYVRDCQTYKEIVDEYTGRLESVRVGKTS